MKQTVSDMMRLCKSPLRPTSTLAEAALTMLTEQAKEATVVDDDGTLLGVISANDLFDVHENTIQSIVKPARVVVPAEGSPSDAVRIMNKVGSDHAIVVDGEKVVGMFTWKDAVERLAD